MSLYVVVLGLETSQCLHCEDGRRRRRKRRRRRRKRKKERKRGRDETLCCSTRAGNCAVPHCHELRWKATKKKKKKAEEEEEEEEERKKEKR